MKILLDANVLIGFFRDPSEQEAFLAQSNRSLLFMSSIVAMELFAGCRTQRQQTALRAFMKPFEKAGRLVTPDHPALLEAGQVLAQLGREGIAKAHRRQLVNDVIISVTAARAGVLVITRNAQDFARIEKYTPVRWLQPQ